MDSLRRPSLSRWNISVGMVCQSRQTIILSAFRSLASGSDCERTLMLYPTKAPPRETGAGFLLFQVTGLLVASAFFASSRSFLIRSQEILQSRPVESDA